MSEWDEQRIYTSNIDGTRGYFKKDVNYDEEDDDDAAIFSGNHDRYQMKNSLREFIRNFREDQLFIYRDQLLRNHRRGENRIEVDLAHLGLFDDILLHFLKMNPNETLQLFEVAAREALGLSTLSGQDGFDSVPFVQVILLSFENAKPLRELCSSDLNRLVIVPGIIISASRSRPKATSIVVSCLNCNNSKQIKLDTAFGGGEAPVRCWNQECIDSRKKATADNLVFLPDRATYMDQQNLKLQEFPEVVPTGEMPRSMLCSVSNYLVDMVSPGMRVSLVGISSVFANKSAERSSMQHVKTPYLRVVGIISQSSEPGSRNSSSVDKFTDEEEERMLAISRTPNLYEKIWRSIAPSISGAYTVDLKKAISCLLFGGSRKRLPDGVKLRGDINVLFLGDPSTAKSQFLKFTERVAPVGVYTSGKGSSAAGLTASVIKDSRGEFYLEGGAMILADGGVVCIDEFDKMREQDRVAIHECMEQQTISIAKAGITTILNSRTSVLAAANPVFGTYNENKSASENIDFLPTILSRFDMIFIVRDVRDADKDRSIAKHVLGIHVSFAGGRRSTTTLEDDASTDEEGEFDMATLKKYISYCRTKCAPCLSPSAAEMLRNHYVSIREEHRRLKHENSQGGASAVPITVRQLEAVIRISESLAKMTLNKDVTCDHVSEAIRLFKVSTLNAAQNNSTNGLTTSSLSPEQAREVMKIEEQIQRMVPIGCVVPTKKLQDDFVLKQGYNAGSVSRALQVLVARNEFAHVNQQKYIKRLR